MSSDATPQDIALEAIVTHLIPHFLRVARGDEAKARAAAIHAVDSYQPMTLIEYRLAAEIVGLGHQILQALAQAADPDLPLTAQHRLRASAVAMRGAAVRTEKRLEQVCAERQEQARAERQAAILAQWEGSPMCQEERAAFADFMRETIGPGRPIPDLDYPPAPPSSVPQPAVGRADQPAAAAPQDRRSAAAAAPQDRRSPATANRTDRQPSPPPAPVYQQPANAAHAQNRQPAPA